MVAAVTRHILGIDPGATGAAALIDLDGNFVEVIDLDSDPAVTTSRLCTLVSGNGFRKETFAMVERAQAMPKQGVSSTFKYGVGFGVILGTLHAMTISHDFVRPARWKAAIGLSGKDKDPSLSLARRLFPAAELGLKKHHNRAEALLIAEYARRFRAKGEGT